MTRLPAVRAAPACLLLVLLEMSLPVAAGMSPAPLLPDALLARGPATPHPPLQTYWSAARTDNTALVSAAGRAAALADGYMAAAVDGFVLGNTSLPRPPGGSGTAVHVLECVTQRQHASGQRAGAGLRGRQQLHPGQARGLAAGCPATSG